MNQRLLRMPVNSQATKFLKCSLLAGLMAALSGCGGSSGDSEPAPANIAVAGTIDIETGTRVDADDADTLNLGSAPLPGPQLLPPEFILAGYVSASAGRYSRDSQLSGNVYLADPVDSFSMTLRTGQSVYLQPFSTSEGSSELTLSLLSGNRVVEIVSSSNQSDPVPVSLPNTEPAGTYELRVEASGTRPMLYILSTSVAGSVSATSFAWPDHDFATAEAIVVLKQGADQVSMSSSVSKASMEPEEELAPGVWLMKAPAQAARSARSQTKESTLEWIQTLKKRPDVASATPNYKMQAQLTPVNEPLYNNPSVGQQWHYELLNAPIAWQIANGGGAGVTVAVMDTGLY